MPQKNKFLNYTKPIKKIYGWQAVVKKPSGYISGGLSDCQKKPADADFLTVWRDGLRPSRRIAC